MLLNSSNERLILELLITYHAMSGLQMIERSEGQLKRGLIYVTLSRMAEKNLIEPCQNDDESSPRLFRATGTGIEAFHAFGVLAWDLVGAVA